MADTILIKAGDNASKALQDRELGYCRADKSLYIGTPNGNVKVSGITETERAAIINEAVAKALEEFEKG